LHSPLPPLPLITTMLSTARRLLPSAARLQAATATQLGSPCALALRAASGKPNPAEMRHNVFKADILERPAQKRPIGLWTGLRNTQIAEMISHTSGLDWFVIDMEHGSNEINDVLLQLQASQHGDAEPVVRVPWNEIVTVKRVLDLGAQSIIFPWVNTAEEARQAVAATRYPGAACGDGVRGVMSLARMNNYGLRNPAYYKEAAGQICTIVQIETLEAAANIEEIAAVDGVDALFIGPSDLSASMGHIGNANHPDVRAKIAECFERIGKTGKASGFLTANHDDCKWALSLGCNFVAIGSDMQILATQTRAYAADFKKFCAEKL